jgi:hypothetical protein
MGKTIYISGKVTAIPYEEALSHFNAAEDFLRTEGWEPVNPLNIENTDPDQSWASWMVVDIKALLPCEAIYMLTNWPTSCGARIERAIAYEMGKQIIYQPEVNNG